MLAAPNSCLVWDPKVGRNRSCYTTTTFSGSPRSEGSKVGTSPLPSWGTKIGQNQVGYCTPCLLGVSKMGDNEIGYINVPSRGPKAAKWGGIKRDTSPGSLLWGGIKLTTSTMFSRGRYCGEENRWLHHPYFLGVSKVA